MSKTFDKNRLEALKTDAYENIESYNDPDTPKALEKFTAQIKGILQADPKMLQSVPEYLPVALYGRVKFTAEANLKWAAWLAKNTMPTWDEFKTSMATALFRAHSELHYRLEYQDPWPTRAQPKAKVFCHSARRTK